MQSSMVDYLTLTAYESLSESDSGGAGEMIIIEDARVRKSEMIGVTEGKGWMGLECDFGWGTTGETARMQQHK